MIKTKVDGAMAHADRNPLAPYPEAPPRHSVFGTLCLTFILWFVLTGTARADDVPVDRSTRVEGPYANLAVHKQAKFVLARSGGLVTATFGSTQSPVQYAARQEPEILFEIPPGFRPGYPVYVDVEGWPISAEGVLDTEATKPHRFRLRVALDGTVRYVDGPELDEVGHVGYMVSTSWPSNDSVGPYFNRELHRESQYRFSRLDDTVHAVFGSASSPVQHTARQAVEALFKVPEGYRPSETVLLTVEGHHVNRDGTPLSGKNDPVRFQIQVGAEGTTLYVDGPELDEVGYLAYQLHAEWPTPPDLDPWHPVVEAEHICGLHPDVQAALLSVLAPTGGSTHDCTSISRAELATIEELELFLALDDTPLRRADLAPLTGLTSLSIRMPDVLLQFLSVDLLESQTVLEALELNLYSNVYWYGLTDSTWLSNTEWQARGKFSVVGSSGSVGWRRFNIDLWRKVPTLALRLPSVDFVHPMWYPHYNKPYRIEGGVSPLRISGLLDQVPGLVKLTVRARIKSCDTPLVVSNPNLKELNLHGLICANPSIDYLYHVPLLEHLTVQSHTLDELPSGFLDRNSHLRSLEITFEDTNKFRPQDRVGDLPQALLANTPRLERLSLQGPTLRPASVPHDLFFHTPELRDVHVEPGILLEWIPPNFAAQVRRVSPYLTVMPTSPRDGQELTFSNLTELRLEIYRSPVEQPPTGTRPCFASGTALRFPILTKLMLMQSWPQEAFSCTVPLVYPELRNLSLNNMESLSPVPHPELLVEALQPAPQLTHLWLDSWEALPPSLFADNPLLESLSVHLGGQAALPDDFLTHTPNLVSLNLDASSLKDELDLPPQWLQNVPKLQTLHIDGPPRTNYPSDLVDYTDDLRHLTLDSMDEEIPRGIGSKTPALEHLELHSYQVTTLPDGFLQNAPMLKHVFLAFGQLASLPEDFLSNAPNLEYLDIRGTFSDLPEQFLAQSHNLSHVHIGDVNRVFNGRYSLDEWLQREQSK